MSSTAYFDSVECGHAQVECDFFRLFGPSADKALPPPAAPYLLTISIRPSLHGHPGAYPQAHAVVDDFGTLRIVERWA
jgi:hypothetical protein